MTGERIRIDRGPFFLGIGGDFYRLHVELGWWLSVMVGTRTPAEIRARRAARRKTAARKAAQS